jgi:hypothetical protein
VSSVSSRIKYLDCFKTAACSDSSAAERDGTPTQRNSDFRQSEHVRRGHRWKAAKILVSVAKIKSNNCVNIEKEA